MSGISARTRTLGRGGRTPARAAGFTLLEVLVVTILLAVVIAAVGACLGGGLRVWDAAQTFGKAEADGLIAMETVCADLRNAYPFQAIGFVGASDRIAFPGMIVTTDGYGARQRRIGTVRYYRDQNALVRETTEYPDGQPQREFMAAHVVDLRFLYYTDLRETAAASTNLPRRVDVALVFDAGEAEGGALALERSVLLASGGAP